MTDISREAIFSARRPDGADELIEIALALRDKVDDLARDLVKVGELLRDRMAHIDELEKEREGRLQKLQEFGRDREAVGLAKTRNKVNELEEDNSAQRNALNDRSEILVAQENEIVALRNQVDELKRQRDARRYQGQHD